MENKVINLKVKTKHRNNNTNDECEAINFKHTWLYFSVQEKVMFSDVSVLFSGGGGYPGQVAHPTLNRSPLPQNKPDLSGEGVP